MKTVAVIGGGVSGLAVAYYLTKTWPPEKGPLRVTVYEAKKRFGGNGDTVHFDLTEGAEPYFRWADLGVNDFNKNAYVELVRVMEKIGFTGYKPLEDSTSYYTLDGATAFVEDAKPSGSNRRQFISPQTKMPESLAKTVEAFMETARKDADKAEYKDYTIEQYIKEKFSDGRIYDQRLGPVIIYPRINGMYFTDDVEPSKMPLRAAMHYYLMQEGIGGKPERMYFVDGASAWIDHLVAYMKRELGVAFVDEFKTELHRVDGTWQLRNARRSAVPGAAPADASEGPDMPVVADIVVVATHADDALKLIRSGTSPEVMNCLGRVKYLDSIAVAHTFSGMLPPDYNAWCTYNILIHQEAAYLKPYTISYVCNRHQNDADNPNYSFFGWPQFFVTLNPPVPIPSKYVLVDDATKRPAMTNLRHNVFNFDCIAAQQDIKQYQGNGNLYFTGGWTAGSGLHEECLIQGIKIAEHIITGQADYDNDYDTSRDSGSFAPLYIRRLLAPEA